MKGLAVLFMIQVHITEFLSTSSFQSSLAGSISMFFGGPTAAPVFLIVLGYFFAASKKTQKQKLLRGCKLIGGGFLLNLGLNASLLFLIADGKSLVNPWRFVFGVDILFAAGLSTIVMTFLEKYLKTSFIVSIILALLAVQIGNFLLLFSFEESSAAAYLAAYIGGSYSWSYFPLFPWLAYPLTGYAVYTFMHRAKATVKLSNTLIIAIYIAGLTMVTFTIGYGIATSAVLKTYYHHPVVFYLWVVCFLAVCSLPLFYLNKNFQAALPIRYIVWIGRQVTAFYVAQWLIIGNSATWLFKTQNTLLLPFWFAGVLFISTLAVYLWEKKLKFVVDNFTEYLTQNG
ncbi:MAG: DUF1624 domain-containing protein [Ignavibacteriales bacterium]|nr:DUF1624 domain-containing protein [Ignavibacteriales bacterium]